jgi:sulfur carrier protein
MKIIINGKEKEFMNSLQLKEVIEQFCKQSNLVIAELNGEIIKSNRWNETQLKDGDTIELVNFVGGG